MSLLGLVRRALASAIALNLKCCLLVHLEASFSYLGVKEIPQRQPHKGSPTKAAWWRYFLVKLDTV